MVRAMVYAGSSGSAAYQPVELSTLDGCTPYSGSNPLYLYPGDQPYQLPTTTWALSTVLTCGLQLPQSNVTAVQVLKSPAYRGFDSPLTNSQVSQAGQFADPNASPVISTDGSESQNTYTRPYLGGTDENAADQVTEDGAPLTIAVYENAPPLVVHAGWKAISGTATAVKIKFHASVQTASGAAVPSSSLTWSWSFPDGVSSTKSTPTHSIAAGTWPVTVQVADHSAGTGGTETIDVSAHASSHAGAHSHSGSNKPTKSKATVGPDRSGAKHPGGSAGAGKTAKGNHAGNHDGGAGKPSNPDKPRRSAAQTSTSASSTTSSARSAQHTAAKTAHPRPSAARRRRRRVALTTAGGSATPIVEGRLISDVVALPPDASPLVIGGPSPGAAAAPVRQATSASPAPIVLAGLVIVVLLGLGAGRELRGSGDWRALRLGS